VAALLIGYARVPTGEQDVTAQRDGLQRLGMVGDRIYVDHGLTGTSRDRPGLCQALAACRTGDTLVVTKLDRLARSLPMRERSRTLTRRKVRLSLGGPLYDPTNPVGRLLFNVLAMVAEFEADLIRSRTREGMRVAKAKGHLQGKQPHAQSTPGHTWSHTASQRGIHYRRVRRPVRRGPLHRLPSPRPHQAGRLAADPTSTGQARRGQSRATAVIAPADAATTTAYRPRHGAPSGLPSENRSRTQRPEPTPRTGH
jgi:DNA invertase Pin-like site-specific DNA recombinase